MENEEINDPKKEKDIDKDNAFTRLNKIQLLIKRESFLYNLCKKLKNIINYSC